MAICPRRRTQKNKLHQELIVKSIVEFLIPVHEVSIPSPSHFYLITLPVKQDVRACPCAQLGAC